MVHDMHMRRRRRRSEQMSTTNKKEWQKEHCKTNKTPNEITVCLQTHESRD